MREALIGLESEGQITSKSGKGFQFARLSVSELEQLAPVIATLEGLALELTPPGQSQELGVRLKRMSVEFDQNLASHSQLTIRDDEWHCVLLSACSNTRLLDLVDQVRGSFHRYEALLVSSDAMIERNASEHESIAECLIEGDLRGAQEALQSNWINGAARRLAGASDSYLSD